MDETHIDDTHQEDGAGDDIAQLQAQYSRIRTLQSLSASAFSDDDARAGHVTRSPLHLASLSSEPLRSPYPDESPITAASGIGISPVSSLRDGWLQELKQELFAEFQSEFRLHRSELLRSKQETARVLQLNAALQKRVEELESASVRVSTPRSSGSHTSTPASPANNTPPDQPAESYLVDPVASLRQLGDFTADEAQWALSQSNNIVDVAADILLSDPLVPSARIRGVESQYRPARGRGRGGYTPQPFRSSLSANSVPIQHSVPVAAGSSTHTDQLASTLGKLTDVIGNLGTLITDNMSRNARSARDPKQKLMSGHKFDTSKIHPYTGVCILGAPDEYWLRPGSWTKHFRNLMLSCTISTDHWTHFALMCCGPTVVNPWETAFEKPGNAAPGWQSSLQLEVQDDGGEVPYARRQSWPTFVRWLTSTFNNHALFEVQHQKFQQISQNPGESVHGYNVRWNLERDLVDELAGAEVYPAGSVQAEELENRYVRSLLGSFSSRLLDLRSIGNTLSQVMPGEARDTASDGGVSIGLQLLQKHAVKLDNDQIIASELRKFLISSDCSENDDSIPDEDEIRSNRLLNN
jgi:hypothetical protein